MSTRQLPLHDQHVEFGGRMMESEGWTLPLEFTGVFKEYQAHQKACVVWDASNLGSIRVRGPGAFGLIQRTFTNDLRRCAAGRSQYTFLLSEADASVVDDLLVWRVERELFILTVNHPDAVFSALKSGPGAARSQPSCTIDDVTPNRVLLAVQGATAKDRIAEIAPAAVSMPAFGVRKMRFQCAPGMTATTRFGGQPGFELYLTPSSARAIYRLLVAQGVTPAGLGMRETHRLEAGIPRYGFELGPGVTPLEAGFPQAVGFDTEFIGRSALVRQRQQGIDKVLRTVVMSGRQAPSPGAALFLNGTQVGRVTSSNFSPRLHRGIAFAFVHPEVPLGSEVTVPATRGGVDGEVATVPVGLGCGRGAARGTRQDSLSAEPAAGPTS